MKTHCLLPIIAALCVAFAICFPQSGRAAALLTTNVQASGANWTAAIWRTNNGSGGPTGAALAPVAGNTYSAIFNGTSLGNNLNATRLRSPAVAGVQTFPGDSLTLNINTELRIKGVGSAVNFPGVGGNPGLILNGGLIDAGDDGAFPITGRVQVNSLSYISQAANGGGGGVSANDRAVNISGILSGSGGLVFLNCRTSVVQQVSNPLNTFSGQWILQCGWLLGATNNSLGTNSIIVDQQYTGYLADYPNVSSVTLGAILEVNYDLNSAGSLTLVNGGSFRLHQNTIFSAATIEGTPLSAGTHFYAELAANFPANFVAGGSGSITIQPFGPPPSLGPTISSQPGPQLLYAGRTANFSVTASANGAPPLTYQWRKAGGNLSTAGNIQAVTNAILTVSSVSALDAANYDVVISNAGGSITSAPVALGIVALTGEAYETAIAAANPAFYYRLNETGDPATNNSPAYDYWGGLNGTYGNGVQNGNSLYNIAGPRVTDGFPGFASANTAAATAHLNGTSQVSAPAWNLKTNTVTLTAWINPSGAQGSAYGIVFCRGGDTVAGLNYSSAADGSGNSTLTYTWNNEADTYLWNSGLVAPPGQWSLVALVITPTNATIHVMNTNGLISASQQHAHVVQSFNAPALIGDDSFGGNSGSRVFNGVIDEVAGFNRALSKTELFTLFTNASALAVYAPLIAVEPASQSLYEQQTAQLAVVGGGSDPLTYQWQAGATGSGIYTNLINGSRVSGADTATLSIVNLNSTDALDYLVIIASTAGSVTSSIATLTVQPVAAPENITMAVQEPAGQDWETGASWSDGLAASVSSVSKPGSTYQVLAGARLRSPVNPTVATFPGDVLTMSGDGIFSLTPTTLSEFRFKQPTYGAVNGIVIFKRLVLNGGQLDVGNEGTLVLGGRIDVNQNAPIYNDGTTDRGYQVDSWLTGSGSIEYHGYNLANYQAAFTRNLNITGTSNTFSGSWNVVIGTLLGSGANSLGTNAITIGTQGALETAYDLNNTNSNLVLNGRMFLHQNDTFKSVFVGGVSLNEGTYSFAALNAAYPTNFPATWTVQTGSTVSVGSGSITVLVQSAPFISQQPQPASVYPGQNVSLTAQVVGNPPLSFQWYKGPTALTDAGTRSGSTTNNLVITSVVSGDAGNYTLIVTNTSGSVTSIVATVTVLTPGSPLNITLDFGGTPVVQPTGNDWNTITNWSDGNPALLSKYSNPGSTYEAVVGSRLRTPAGTNNNIFPGDQLTVDGSGIFENNTLGAVGELRFKNGSDPSINYFKKLVLNGGQIDAGDNSLMVIQGELNVSNNSAIYVDSAAVNDRGYQVDSWLTGSGSLTWHQFSGVLGGLDLLITGTTNTFNGQWIVDQGALVGAGANSLGTNNLTVGTNGLTAAVETLYDINNPNGSLILDVAGEMFLHQNDTFGSVTVNGTPLASGTYSFATLNSTYPANFPASWTQQAGSSFSTGSGSITVGAVTGPTTNATISQVSLIGASLVIHGNNNNVPSSAFHYVVLISTNVALPLSNWTAVTTNSFNPDGTFDYTNAIVPSIPQQFLNVKVVP